MVRLLAAVSLLLAVLVGATPVLADTAVGGTLWMSGSARKAALRQRGGPLPRQHGVTEGVVWVEKIPGAVQERLAAPSRGWFRFGRVRRETLPSVTQRGERFTPRVVAVPAGGAVEFANPDRLYHSAFSVSEARRFDLGQLAPGGRDTLAFPRPGLVNLHCEIHPGAIGFVVVTPNRAYAIPDSTGRFRLPKLPPGRYVLRAWHPRGGELKLPFDVPRRGAVDLNPAF